MKRKTFLFASFLSIYIHAGCATVQTPSILAAPSQESLGVPSPTVHVEHSAISSITAAGYPRVDGSTSAYPLQLMIACNILKVRCSWSEGDFLDPTRRIVPDTGFQGGKEVEALTRIVHHGTHGAYENLINKQADFILVAREPSEDERDLAAVANVELDVQPIARDAFVFLVHAGNPVKRLSLKQLRAIYTGRITNWAEVGGVEAEIHTYQRNPNSGSQELMERLVMEGEEMLDSPDMILETMMGPINAIRDDPLGIGYSVYFYAAHIYPDENVRMLALDGIEPEALTIADGSYALGTEVFAVLRGDAEPSDLAVKLRDWLLTKEGQFVVEESGYVAISD